MEVLEQQLSEVSLIYTNFEQSLATGFEKFQTKINDLIANTAAEQTPNPKGKRAKHMPRIQDDPESEEIESSSAGDTTVNTSSRPQRSTRTKNATSYKEPSLVAKIRRPSPDKIIKKERISNDGKENHAPNETVTLSDAEVQPRVRLTRTKTAEEPHKRKSNEADGTDSTGAAKKVKLSEVDTVEIIESPSEIVTIVSDDETDKMPPPMMPAPKTRGRPRTRKASKQAEGISDHDDTQTRVKVERPSVVASEPSTDTSQNRTTRTKSKKKVIPMPIQLPPDVSVKQEKVSLDKAQESKRTSGASEASVYEDAQPTSAKTSTNNASDAALDATYTKANTPNSTVTLENATFNIPKNGSLNNETFQVQSPQEINGTYTVPAVPTPNVHDSIMTEDRSDDESDVAAAIPVKKIGSEPSLTKNGKHVPNSKKYEIFNPNIPSPIKAKVQAFEKFTAASGSNGFMSPSSKLRMPPGRLVTTPAKLTTPLSMPKIPVIKPMSAHGTPLMQSHSAPMSNKAASVSKLTHMPKKVGSKQSTSSSSRDPSVEDLKRTAAAIADKKKIREEKQRLAQLQREQLEKERRERTKLLQKEKEEKHRKLLQEKEERKRELMTQKKLEDHMRNQKIMEQKRRELMEKEALEAAKAKHNESLQRKVLQKQHNKHKTKHDFEVLDTDDSTDDEGKMNKNRAPPPLWSKGSYRRNTTREQTFVNLKIIDKFFSVQPMTPDLKEIFPTIEPKKLKRNSSAVWNTPPRYSQMPKY